MNRLAALLTVVAFALACVPRREGAPSPEGHVGVALAALDEGDVQGAATHLLIAADEGDQAGVPDGVLLMASVLALDARNPRRSPNVAARLAARYAEQAKAPWDAELGTSLYYLAIDLGASPVRPAPGGAKARRLAGAPLAARLDSLEQTVARLERELVRVRETLKP
jgi:hypothetical protein